MSEEQRAGAEQPSQRDEPVEQPAAGDLPRGVEGGLHRADHREPGPEQADQADDRRRLPAVLGDDDGVLHRLGGLALEAQLADHVAGEVGVARRTGSRPPR